MVLISSMKSSQKPVTSDVPQGLIPVPILFEIFIMDQENVEKFTLSNFADETKLGRRLIILTVWKKQTNKKKGLPLRSNTMHQDRLGTYWVESSLAQNMGGQYGIQVDTLTMRQHYSLAAKMINSTLNCIRNLQPYRLRKVIFPIHSALVRPHLYICSIVSRSRITCTRKILTYCNRSNKGPLR